MSRGGGDGLVQGAVCGAWLAAVARPAIPVPELDLGKPKWSSQQVAHPAFATWLTHRCLAPLVCR